ncbi:hypothetical protein ONE63_002526 [Megalurothrips usitatus]|uniref:Uncharacterized protein n=1 Tax=Megalurothrips usitatus TaxID=439358 RepID=A0AAV7XCP5_9NEOP|nr:hypothetical protein ONE63_002526 [Megalurothrips usitatus]
MKVALFVVVAIVAALHVQASAAADTDGALSFDLAPHRLANIGSCLVRAASSIGSEIVKIATACIGGPQELMICITGAIPQFFQDVILEYSVCLDEQ